MKSLGAGVKVKPIQSEAGFGLIAALGVSALGMIMISGMAGILAASFSEQASDQFRREGDTIVREVNAFLSSSEICTANFSGVNLNAGLNQDVMSLRNLDGSEQYRVGAQYGDSNFTLRGMGLEDYSTTGFQASFSGVMFLNLDFERTNEDGGLKTIRRRVEILTSPNASGSLIRCVARSLGQPGIWSRVTSNLFAIFYDEGLVTVGTDQLQVTPGNIAVRNDDRMGVWLENREGSASVEPTSMDVYNYKGSESQSNYSVMHLLQARGTRDAPQSLRAGDAIGKIPFLGYTGAAGNPWLVDDAPAAMIYATAERAFNGANTPSTLIFATSDGSSTDPLKTRLHINSEGHVGINYEDSPNNLRIHSPNGRGMLVLSGIGDGNSTHSAVYLSDGDFSSVAQNSWVFAFKRHQGYTDLNSFHFTRWGDGDHIPIRLQPDGRVAMHTRAPKAGTDFHLEGTALFSGASTLLENGNVVVRGELDAEGRITANAVLTSSDRNLKKQVKAYRPGKLLSWIEKLVPVQFRWKDRTRGEKPQVGFIAQDVAEIFPEAVSEGDDGYLRIDYPALSAILLGGVNELTEKTKNLCDPNVRKEFDSLRLEQSQLDQELAAVEAEAARLKADIIAALKAQ